jgi:hypothetical protein
MAKRNSANPALVNAIVAAVGAIIVAVIYVFGPGWIKPPPPKDPTRSNPTITIRGYIHDGAHSPLGDINASIFNNVEKNVTLANSRSFTVSGMFLLILDSVTASASRPLSVRISDKSYEEVSLPLDVTESDFKRGYKDLGTVVLRKIVSPLPKTSKHVIPQNQDTGKVIESETDIIGVVKDNDNGDGLSGVQVIVDAHSQSCYTDDEGRFHLKVRLQQGEEPQIRAVRDGFRTATRYVTQPSAKLEIRMRKK